MPNSIRITRLLQQGIDAAKSGQTQEARQALLQVIELDERNEQAWIWLSGVVESLEDCHICLENVLAINPDNPHAQRGLRLLDRQSAPAHSQERCPLCQSPISPSGSTCSQCGQILIIPCPNCKDYVEVSETSCPKCGQRLGDFRAGALYHIGLAQEYLKRNKRDLAQEAIAHAKAAALDDVHALKDVAAMHEEMGHTDMAISVYELAIQHNPNDAFLYARLGAIYRQRTMPTEALEMYKLAAQKANDEPEILYKLAELYDAEYGATFKNIRLLKRAVRLDPEHAGAHFLLGDVYIERGEWWKAAQCYEQAYEFAPTDSLLKRDARRKLAKLQPSMPYQAHGWGETLRLMCGLMISPALAALVNARLILWEIGPLAWAALAMATMGAYLWTCAADVPRNPAMREIFGREGMKARWQKVLLGLPGILLWAVALGLILGKV